MKKSITISYTINELHTVAQQLAALRATCAIFTFTGSLGAGKTTLVRELLRICGVTTPITSPTFTYVNLYTNEKKETFYHFDCYRLTTTQQFIEAGFDEYLYVPDSYSFIEWPQVVMPLLTHNVCHVIIEYDGHEARSLTYTIT